MKHVTCDDLVQAVSELSPRVGGRRLVGTAEIKVWFNNHQLDYGEGKGERIFQAADYCEASKEHPRLLKFKEGHAPNAPVYFALSFYEFAIEAKTEAHQHGWLEVLWDGEQWDWQNALPA